MRRRDVLTAALSAPAAALAGSLPAVAAMETPIMALFRRHGALIAAAKAYPPTDDAELDRLFYGEIYRIEDQILAIPSQTPTDMAAKMIVGHGHDGCASLLDFDGGYWAEARALVGYCIGE